MAMENRFCPNCGTQVVMQNGKIVCPNCGTEFAIDWGKEDVARAADATAAERAQANMQRHQAIDATRAAIAERERANQRSREMSKAFRPLINMAIAVGVTLAVLYVGGLLFKVGIRMFAKSSSSKDLFGENDTFASTVETATPEKITADEEYLENAVAAGVYFLNYEIPNEVLFEQEEKTGHKTGNYDIDSFYYVHTKDEAKLCIVYAVEFQIEDSDETVTTFVPVMSDVLNMYNGTEVLSRYDTRYIFGKEKKEYGYLDHDLMVEDSILWGEGTKAEEMAVPDSAREYLKKA